VIADEPTTALDVITQSMVVKLMGAMKHQNGTAILFITHNLALAANVCDRIAVMRGGRIVEQAYAKEIFYSAKHPYTRLLISSIPSIRDRTVDLRDTP
jgi:oligopeptide transport system ATP-binding protein